MNTIDMWAILELMGHIRLAGRITEENHFGGVLGRIDIPQPDGSSITQWFGVSTIYRITPTTEEIARDIAATHTPKPISVWDLMHLLPAPHPNIREEDEDEQ